MKIVNNRLVGDNVDFVEANNYGKKTTMIPTSIIIHYTAGDNGKTSVKYFALSTTKTSAHLVINEDGKVTQMVPFDKTAYHAGTSSYEGLTSFNNFSIGIEISNPGYLTKNTKGTGYVTWLEASKANPTPVADDMVFEGTHRNSVTKMKYWYKYTDEQIAVIEEICKLIAETYEIKYILGHEEIAVGRKTDPGPAYPLDELRTKILNATPKTLAEKFRESIVPSNILKQGVVTAGKLNFRASASTEAEKLTDPILKNTIVSIIKDEGDWYKVLHKVKGWVKRTDLVHDNTDSEEDAEVSADKLIIRQSAKESALQLLNPMKKGDRVFLHDQFDNWILVTALVPGYLMKQYIQVDV
jgi:N-acetylmuramoyl-L-alanine amidase